MSHTVEKANRYSLFDILTKRLLFRSFMYGDFWFRDFQRTGEFRSSLNKDIDLCYTFSHKRNDAAVAVLLSNEISFMQKVVKIPLIMRPAFHNMKRIYIIQVNRNCYYDACRLINRMEPHLRCKLKIANY